MMIHKSTIAYKGKKHTLLHIKVKHKVHFKDGVKITLGTESFEEILKKNFETDEQAVGIDEKIYFYIPDKMMKDCQRESDVRKIVENELDEEGFEMMDFWG
jgi:hypothetical protein